MVSIQRSCAREVVLVGRLVGYFASFFASLIGWQIGHPLGLVAALLLSTIFAAVGMYAARRWWQQNMD